MSNRRRRSARQVGQQGSPKLGTDGWWRIRFREWPDESGERPQRKIRIGTHDQFPSEALAQAEANRIIATLVPPRLIPGGSLPWVTWCDRYDHEFIGPIVRRGSTSTYRSILRQHIRRYFDGKRTDEITLPLIQQWVSAMLGQKGAAAVARETVKQRFSLLRLMLNTAISMGVAAHPISSKQIKFGSQSEVEIELEDKSFSATEMARITDDPAPLDQLARTYFQLLRWTGLRGCEASGLTWKNVDLDRELVRVRQNASRRELGPTKTPRSRRDVTMGEELARVMRAWHHVAPANPLWLVFPDEDGKPIDTQKMRLKYLRPRLEQLGLVEGERSLHAFRHGHCFWLMDTGTNVATIRDRMGHTSIKQTNRYARHATPEEQLKAVRALSNFNLVKGL